MIKEIRYIAGNIEYATDNNRAILKCERVLLSERGEIQQRESNLDDPRFSDAGAAKDTFSAVKGFVEKIDGPVKFSSNSCEVEWGDRRINPDSDTSGLPPDLQAFVSAIYSYNNGEYRAKWEAKQLKVEVSPEPTAEELKAIERAKVEQAYNAQIDALVAGYPARVRETWPHQEAEARAWLANNTAPTPTLDGIVERSGRDKAALVSSIITKADYFKAESGRALGDMQAALAALG